MSGRREITYRTAGSRPLRLHVSPPSEPPSEPGNAPAPTAVFFHGGGWVQGTWRQFRPQAAHLNALGLLTVLVEYRTEGPVTATADAVAAMNAVVEHAGDLGCDTERMVAIGGSAGAHLALATAVLDLPDAVVRRRPAALVLLNPVTDTTGDFPAGYGRRHFENDEIAHRYSPAHHLSSATPPTLVMHGTADAVVHHENSSAFVDGIRRHGGQAEIILYPDQPHGFFNPPATAGRRADDDTASMFAVTTKEMAGFIGRTILGNS